MNVRRRPQWTRESSPVGRSRIVLGRWPLAAALSIAGALASCGPTPPTSSAPSTEDWVVELQSNVAAPLEQVRAVVRDGRGAEVDPTSLGLRVYSESGYDLELPITAHGGNDFSFYAPFGVMNPESLVVESGVVMLYAYERSDPVRASDRLASLEIRKRQLPSAAPGEISRAFVTALKATHEAASRNYQVLQTNVAALTAGELPRVIQRHGDYVLLFERLLEDIGAAQRGEVVPMGGVNGVETALTYDSLTRLDEFFVAVFGIVPTPATNSLRADGTFATLSLDFDLPNMGALWRDVGERVGTAVGYAATGLIVGGVLIGSSPVLTAGVTLGALGFLCATVVPGVVGMVNDVASAAMLNGRATFDEFRESARYFFDNGFSRWTAPFVLPETGPIAGALLGELYDATVEQASRLVDGTVDVVESVQNAYDSGAIPDIGLGGPDGHPWCDDITLKECPLDPPVSPPREGGPLR